MTIQTRVWNFLFKDIDRDEYLIGNNRSENNFSGKSDQPIEIVHASGFSGATRVERASSDEIFKPQIDIVHDHPKTRGKLKKSNKL